MSGESAQLEWRGDRVPVSRRFDDPYYSLDDGLAEARHVFLAGNDLPSRFEPGFHIAELGFGTGLNLLAALQSFEEAGCAGKLRFTSFEAYPMAPHDMIRAQAAFPTLEPIARELRGYWGSGAQSFETPKLEFRLVTGDARASVPRWEDRADAWFLDGFAPARNPELWEPGLLKEVARHTNTGGSAATYSAAGHVRRALEDAGFTVERVPGYGTKRHMTRAKMTS